MNIPSLLSIALPVLLGAIVWLFQALAQRAWSDYEVRLGLYREVVREMDYLISGTKGVEHRRILLSKFRELRLIANDDVVLCLNALTSAIKSSDMTRANDLYSDLMIAMRSDIRKRRFLPPNGTKLQAKDFPIES